MGALGGGGSATRRGLLSRADFREVVLRNVPVIVRGAAASWPAIERWKPERLAAHYGSVPVEYLVGAPDVDPPAELAERTRRTTMAEFVRELTARPVSDELYMVVRNFSLQGLREGAREYRLVMGGR